MTTFRIHNGKLCCEDEKKPILNHFINLQAISEVILKNELLIGTHLQIFTSGDAPYDFKFSSKEEALKVYNMLLNAKE